MNYFTRKNIIITSLVVVVMAFAITVSANISFMDKISQVAGEIVGNGIMEKVGDSIEVDDTPKLGASASTLNRWTDQSGLVTYVVGGEFDSSDLASTTLVSFLNPFLEGTATSTTDGALSWNKNNNWDGSTTTVDLGIVSYDGTATSSFELQCGPSEDPYSAPSYYLINTLADGNADNSVPTSTASHIENNVGLSYGQGVIMAGSSTKALLTPSYPYITCVATSTADNWSEFGEDALIGSTSLLDGSYKFRFYRDQY